MGIFRLLALAGVAVASLAGTPRPAPAAHLTVVPEAEIVALDPHFIGAYTLDAPDSNFNDRPQMVRDHTVWASPA